MMKKTALALCGVFLFSSLSFSYPGWHEDKDMHYKEKRERMSDVRKEKREYFQELEKLIEKYNKASDKKKDNVKKEITALISKEADKDITFKKERLAEMQERLNDLEENKEDYVGKKVERILSPEGQERINAINNDEWPDKGKHKKREGRHHKRDMM